jgi:hypothetical protein
MYRSVPLHEKIYKRLIKPKNEAAFMTCISYGNRVTGIAWDEFMISVVTLAEIFYDDVCKMPWMAF